jgi:hypothetical protein
MTIGPSSSRSAITCKVAPMRRRVLGARNAAAPLAPDHAEIFETELVESVRRHDDGVEGEQLPASTLRFIERGKSIRCPQRIDGELRIMPSQRRHFTWRNLLGRPCHTGMIVQFCGHVVGRGVGGS